MVPGKNWQETASRTTSHILFATWDKATRIKIQRRFSLRGRRDEDAGSINHERARSKVQRECVRDRGWQSDYPKPRSGNASSAKEETGQNISQMFHEWSCVSVFFPRNYQRVNFISGDVGTLSFAPQQVYEITSSSR